MISTHFTASAAAPQARLAGLLYIVIIIAGISAEFLLRAPLLSGPAPLASIAQDSFDFRLSLTADLVMILADVALAVLLFQLLRSVSVGIATGAMIFRLMQAALLAAMLLTMSMVPLLVDRGLLDAASAILAAHATGYDLALVFFGIGTALTAWLLAQRDAVPRLLIAGLAVSAPIYMAGGALRLAAPDLIPVLQPAYLMPFLAETSFAVWLLVTGRV